MYMAALVSRRVGGVGFSSCIFECEMYPPKLRFSPLFKPFHSGRMTRTVNSGLTLPFFKKRDPESSHLQLKKE